MRRFTIVLVAAAASGAICFAALRFVDNIDTLRLVLWPAAFIADAFPPPCFDQGPGQKPFCEGTPVQLVAGVVGLGITWLLYSTVLGALLAWWTRKRQGQFG